MTFTPRVRGTCTAAAPNAAMLDHPDEVKVGEPIPAGEPWAAQRIVCPNCGRERTDYIATRPVRL